MIKKILVGNAFSIEWFPVKPNSIVSLPTLVESELYVYLVSPYKKIRITPSRITYSSISFDILEEELLNSITSGKYSLEVVWKKENANDKSHTIWSRVFKKNAFEITEFAEEANVLLSTHLSIYSFRI